MATIQLASESNEFLKLLNKNEVRYRMRRVEAANRSVENPRVFIFLGEPEADRGGSVSRGNRFLTVAAPIGPKAHGHSLTVATLNLAAHG